ncbi:cytosine/adenosine deaminase-related metal-dependent hydrolase [Actinoplanes lutulentus]|uniref:Cytosine/adenosine deaminase-related metal-dependent hydrolase n=1 Tax=Actinoplanes lutulentus TaxID=1287878 RepID=A0A327ZJN5_9ACTN|nr:amidohydrolase family protein [Actinoplanes lutulentus]MBB2940560.1 cytosine/adenosine deaminase-related metal-dependent hydrolase [Actinoplanes lutulentus]RAK42873.1 cytosine/adenosine deaminase-related metal-dependent hydrolase [Actinoplanes lutulentus]
MSRKLIRGGHVLSIDPAIGEIAGGDVLIDGGRIVEVGTGIDAPDAEIVDATGMIVMPGLIDTHRHTWQGGFAQAAADWTLNDYFAGIIGRLSPVFTPGDVRDGTYYGALDALDSGVTTLFDWAHIMNTPEHADASVEALSASGIRAVFGHSIPTSDPSWYYASERPHPVDARRLASQYFSSTDQLLTLALAIRGPEMSTIATTANDIALARELGVRSSLHVGIGLLAQARAITQMHESGLLGPDLIFLHANSSTDDELKMLADSGGNASVSARVEMMMGHGTPATGRLLAVGIRPALSLDVTAGVPSTLFGEMRAVLEAERNVQYQQQLDLGAAPESVPLTSRQAIEFATIEGARTLGLDDRVGSLTPGKRADVILVNPASSPLRITPDPAVAVLFADSRDVDTVLIDGEFRKRGGVLVGVDAGGARDRAVASRDRVLAAAGS